MRKIIKISAATLTLTLLGFFLSGCNLFSLLYPEPVPTAVLTPTPLYTPEISVCIGSEPRSLFAFKAASSAEREVLQALTDGPVDVLSNGERRPIILEDFPSVENGAITFIPLDVAVGDTVANSAGNLVSLEAGVEVFPSGCNSPACAQVWDGASPLKVDQLVITFKLKDDLKWSDGQPLTADDSVYSFGLAADPLTPVSKQYVDLTESYKALDAKTLEWIGMPGFITDALENIFWAPLPFHAWGGINTAVLLEDEAANRMPLSYGPFMVEDWQQGSYIRLARNPYYHRAGEGLPAANILTFKFLSAEDPASQLMAAQAECDIVSPSALDLQDILHLRENTDNYGMQLIDLPPDSLEMLAFGIMPSSYDDNYNPYGLDRPDLFGDVRIRQAFAHCIDQQTIENKLLAGAVSAASGMLPSDHPLMDGITLIDYSYDPAAGIALLEQVGWQDADLNPDTPISATSINNIPFGTLFEVDLMTSSSNLRTDIAAEIAGNLSACGVKVNLKPTPLADLYQPAPGGPLFGRNFDLALLSFQTGNAFDCRWFNADEIPSEGNYWLGSSTGGANFFGYQSSEYDAQCAQHLRSGMDVAAESASLQNAISILSNDLPVIPLFFHPRALLVRDTLCGYSDTAQLREGLMIIEQIGLDDGC